MSKTAPLWSLCSLNDRVLPESAPSDYEFEYVDISNVEQNYISDELEVYTFKDAPSRARRLAETGDVLVSTVRTYLRAIAQVRDHDRQRVYSTGFAVLSPIDGRADSRYLSYVLTADVVVDEIIARSTGVSYPAIQGSELHRLRIPTHELKTQRRIADYLDRETVEIDAMTDKLNEVEHELLRRRAGAIQRQTIQSGGTLTRLKFCADVSLGKTFQGVQKNPEERFVNYIRAASIQIHGLQLDDQRMWMTDDELQRYNLLTGDVLIVEGGAGYGRSVVLSHPMPGWGFQNHVIRVRPRKGYEGRFLNYCVKAHFDAGLIDILVDGATIPALSSDKARELPVLAVSLEEQRRIADHLDDVTSKIDAMLTKVAQLKDLLTERRAALITDVVTGRKDVA